MIIIDQIKIVTERKKFKDKRLTSLTVSMHFFFMAVTIHNASSIIGSLSCI